VNTDSKLMDMLTGYAAAHQHPVNIAVHLIGIPCIMLGVFIPLTWVKTEIAGFGLNLAQVVLIGMFPFYASLDTMFAIVFLALAIAVTQLAARLGGYPQGTAWTIATTAFFGGYAAQFIGHAVEKSKPVIVKHPIQASLAAPFFTIVEIFNMLGLRDALFTEVRRRISELRKGQANTV
jgi:uncharacterized membrane protein YGL010W